MVSSLTWRNSHLQHTQHETVMVRYSVAMVAYEQRFCLQSLSMQFQVWIGL